MNKKQFNEITEWQDATFPKSTTLSRISHLKQEVNELFDAIALDMPTEQEKESEFADCFILLFGAAKKHGLDYENICRVIDDKMKVNYSREWGKPDENGVVNHVKTTN